MKHVLEQYKLTGKKAVVTGGLSGIGKAVSIALAQAGADVAIADIATDSNQAAKDAVLKELALYSKDSFAIKVDVSNYEEVFAVRDKIKERWGRVDILFNNAGISHTVEPEKSSKEDWAKVININLNGAFYCAQAFGQMMIEQGSGSIISTGSISGNIINRPEEVAYSVSKAGIHQLTRGLAASWAKYGVRVNAISPGFFATELSLPKILKYPELVKQFCTDWTPMNRIGEPEELGGIVVYLASDASSFCTGACITIDGGFTLY